VVEMLPAIDRDDIISVIVKEIDKYMIEHNVKHFAIRRIKFEPQHVVAYVVAYINGEVKLIKFLYDEENGLRPVS